MTGGDVDGHEHVAEVVAQLGDRGGASRAEERVAQRLQ
jgi:hypothetical protein